MPGTTTTGTVPGTTTTGTVPGTTTTGTGTGAGTLSPATQPGTTGRPGQTLVGGPVAAPATAPLVTVVPARAPLVTVVPARHLASAAGAALPFTGSNTILFAQAGLLMLLIGTGLMLATRQQVPRRAVV
ncbi:MAG: hypothetical protein NVS3B26_18200 [Mycobacteriales bacterium]